MRQLFLASGVVVLAAVSWGGEVSMTVTGVGGMSGSAKVTNKILEDGSKYVNLSMELKSPSGGTVSVMQESAYDKTGKPVRKIQVTSLGANSTKQSVVVTFNEAGANVKVDAGERSVRDLLPWPEGKLVAAKTEFWFIRDQPAPGGTATYHRFDIGTMQWVETKSVYRGRREVKAGGKTVLAHLVEYGDAKAYLDDKGDPIRVETGSTVMERQW